MIKSPEMAAILREQIAQSQERILRKQLAQRLGYHRRSVYDAIELGKFTEPILLRFAFIFPSIKQNPTYIHLITLLRD
jgi:predicted DNA-binding transcriptional regulator AlpA